MTEPYSQDVDDDTAFERLFLATAFPLAFGAAWKGLDVLLEYAFNAAGHSCQRQSHWRSLKRWHSQLEPLAKADPFSNDVAVWRALTTLYLQTEEIRHSLVHRRITRLADRALVGRTRSGSPLRPLTLPEQESFCLPLQRSLDAVIRGSITRREREDLGWQLDQLQGVHGQQSVGGHQVTRVRRFTVAVEPVEGRFKLDATQLKTRLAQPGTGQWIEVQFECAAAGNYLADLEDVPDGQHVVDLQAPPTWMRRTKEPH